jgi:hypothetical protein
MVVHICNSSTQEAEAGRLWAWGQPRLYSKQDTVSTVCVCVWVGVCVCVCVCDEIFSTNTETDFRRYKVYKTCVHHTLSNTKYYKSFLLLPV